MSVSKARLSELRCASCRCSSPGKSRSRRLEGQELSAQHSGISAFGQGPERRRSLVSSAQQRELSP
jgi:hypothetical protein